MPYILPSPPEDRQCRVIVSYGHWGLALLPSLYKLRGNPTVDLTSESKEEDTAGNVDVHSPLMS